jgi:hypothetical protein
MVCGVLYPVVFYTPGTVASTICLQIQAMKKGTTRSGIVDASVCLVFANARLLTWALSKPLLCIQLLLQLQFVLQQLF